jgi:Flp pilus assembly protein TadD
MMARAAMLAICAALLAGCGTARHVGSGPPAAPQTAEAQQLYLDLIRGLRQRGLHRAVIAHLDDFERQNGERPATILLRGQALNDIGDHEGALRAFSRITGGPEFPAARQGMGLAAAGAGLLPEATELLETAVRLEPTNPRFLNNLGFVQLQQGNVQQAESRLRTAAELDAESAEIRNNIALLLLATNRRAEGEQLLAMVPSQETRNAIRREAQRLSARPERRS